MLPEPVADDALYGANADFELVGQFLTIMRLGTKQFSNLPNLLGREFGVSVSFSDCISLLSMSVRRVLNTGRKIKMFRAATPRHIAVVTHTHPIWNLTLGIKVGEAVGFRGILVKARRAISEAVKRTTPRPARIRAIGFAYSFPEVFRGIWVLWHNRKTPTTPKAKSAQQGGRWDSWRKTNGLLHLYDRFDGDTILA